MPAKMGGLKDRFVKRAIDRARRQAVQKMISKGRNPYQAENDVASVSDTDILDFINKKKLKFGADGPGGILQWFTDHLPQILEIVKFIMSLFAMFATTGPDDDEEESKSSTLKEEIAKIAPPPNEDK